MSSDVVCDVCGVDPYLRVVRDEAGPGDIFTRRVGLYPVGAPQVAADGIEPLQVAKYFQVDAYDPLQSFA